MVVYADVKPCKRLLSPTETTRAATRPCGSINEVSPDQVRLKTPQSAHICPVHIKFVDSFSTAETRMHLFC